MERPSNEWPTLEEAIARGDARALAHHAGNADDTVSDAATEALEELAEDEDDEDPSP